SGKEHGKKGVKAKWGWRGGGKRGRAADRWEGTEEWHAEEGEDLRQEQEEEEKVVPPAPPHVCCGPHIQFASRQRVNANYKLFAAAADGCLDC
ncbi:MAG: hypothetical protein GY772_28240, partial [bacterium]|nr:hypothetical protein [bacterium]